MGLKGRFKRATSTKDGTLRYPTTVEFDVEQYKAIEHLKLDGCKSFGSKVRCLVGLGLKMSEDGLGDTLEARKESVRKSRESS